MSHHKLFLKGNLCQVFRSKTCYWWVWCVKQSSGFWLIYYKLASLLSWDDTWTSLSYKYLQLPMSHPCLAALALSWTSSSLCCPQQPLCDRPSTSPTPQQSQTNDFDLSSTVQRRSYRYNPPNDVKDLSAKLINDKTFHLFPLSFLPLPT